ncbi:MAG: cysteine--tRNA ligase [Pseudolabrys sp.]|nr:cysteine--tRNA ligase [Pseudolabrys sp.]MSP32289.1 cysteine--tRNA ligase [Pseudolabrys sp.]
MEIKLYDTLTREKRVFTPLDPARVRMYVCGPTVYDFAHIGNARPVIVFDVLFRLLRHIYGDAHVTYVRNITDVDDKINVRAAERGIAIRELTEETYKNFKSDVEALGCLPPTVEPRATEHIEEMKVLIERLVKSGHAYVAEDHVLFSVPSMPEYGKLSGRPLDEMIAGARVEVASYKKDPQDFVLWKPSKPGEPAWPSPAGIKTQGRPGWHIECSAMAWKHLGETFDIHGGGIDLVFPHNENEIAQSRCAFHTGVMANYWMHNGFLQVEGDKMSKSVGNFVTIHELLKDWPGEVVRLCMLQTHYRQPINWTVVGLREAQKTLDQWYELTADMVPGYLCADTLDALADDFNTPKAFAAMHELRGEAVKGAKPAAACLKASAQLIGLLRNTTAEWKSFRPASIAVDEAKVLSLIEARNAARKAKDFKESDLIRDELAAMGVVLKDSKDGTTWEIAR